MDSVREVSRNKKNMRSAPICDILFADFRRQESHLRNVPWLTAVGRQPVDLSGKSSI